VPVVLLVGDTAFVGAGNGGGNPYLQDMWRYVPSSNSWTQMADFGGGKRSQGLGFTINNIGYIGSGLETGTKGRGDFWQYNKSTDSWTQVASMPGTAVMGAVSFVIKDLAFVGTGYNLSSRVNDFYAFDAAKNSWTKADSIPSNLLVRHEAIGFSINNIGYVCTGSGESLTLEDLWAYNPYNLAGTGKKLSKNSSIKTYPNPITDFLSIECSAEEKVVEFEVFNLAGQRLLESKSNTSELSKIDLSNLNSGIYLLKIKTSEGSNTLRIEKL
jgi:N-acetylneuraminic acid mutarotase